MADSKEDFTNINTVNVNLQCFDRNFKDKDLAEIFADVGEVKKARFVRRKNGRPRGKNFVQFGTHEEALKACQMKNNSLYKNIRMGVILAQSNLDERRQQQEAKEKTESPAKADQAEAGEVSAEVQEAKAKLAELLATFGPETMAAMSGMEVNGMELTMKKKATKKRRNRRKKKGKKSQDSDPESPKRAPEKSAKEAEEDLEGQEQKPKKNTKKRLFVKGLPEGIDSEALQAVFEKLGEVENCKVKPAARDGALVAFVKMASADVAEQLVQKKQLLINDTEAMVIWARSGRQRRN